VAKRTFRDTIYNCPCVRCRAVVRLVEEHGAVLQFSATRAGRLCELAVVAAEEEAGLPSRKVVQERRKYAQHLGIELRGPISDSDEPVHIDHAIHNSNHNPNARNRVNLGSAVASCSDGRYFIRATVPSPNTSLERSRDG
jgi:hypothetical protein